MAVRYNQRWEETERSATPVETLFNSYALFKRSEGKASSTISWYDDKLREFLRWAEARQYGTDLGSFTIDRVREYVLYLQEREDRYEQNAFAPTLREKLSSQIVQGHVRTPKTFARHRRQGWAI